MTVHVTAKTEGTAALLTELRRLAATARVYRVGKNSIARLVALLVATAAMAFGGLIRLPSLSYLQQTADLIVFGTASGEFPVGSGNFSLLVNRVIKGNTQLAGDLI